MTCNFCVVESIVFMIDKHTGTLATDTLFRGMNGAMKPTVETNNSDINRHE